MDNRTVRLGRACLRGVAGLGLAAILLTGCRSTPKTEDYVDIPELPGTPIGTPVASNPSATAPSTSTVDTSSATATPAPALTTPVAPADSKATTAIASSSTTTQVNAAGSSDSLPAATSQVTQKHAAPATAESKSEDQIRVGEMLHIVFSDTPQTIPPVDDKVKQDGTITLMYNQTFHATDKTPGDLAQEIRKRYVPDYFQQLTASVIRDVARVYYVDGEVRTPSKQLYTGPITVTQAIASAGGFTDFANRRKVKLIRAGSKKTEVINCKEAIERPEKDPEVYPGDKVVVPRSLF